MHRRIALHALLIVLAASCAGPSRPSKAPRPAPLDASVPEAAGFEGDARGYPVLRDATGARRADGELTQWLEGERLHVQLRFDSGDGHVIEERAVLRQAPELVQESWSWSEHRDGTLERRFAADLLTGAATAEKLGEDGLRTWSDVVEVEPGRTFAGVGWPHAIRSVHARLIAGETLAFRTLGFVPEPRAATVELSWDGPEEVPMGSRVLAGDRFRVHPVLSWLERLVVTVPDSSIWLTRTPPHGFLRWEGPLAEPGDAPVRVDVVPGEPSRPAHAAGGD
jgi:hypothetical protein